MLEENKCCLSSGNLSPIVLKAESPKLNCALFHNIIAETINVIDMSF